MPHDVEGVVASLKRAASRSYRDGLARFAIPADRAFGVPMGTIQKLAKTLGRDHDLAAALWETGHYEARLLCAFVDNPASVTPAQMDRWCRDFDNWAICDTITFHLFDRTPHAFKKVAAWSKRKPEFEKRAAFALLAALALHDKSTADEAFERTLPLIEKAAADERNFVKKGVSWALRSVGRRSPALHADSVTLAKQLVDSTDPAARWVGKDVLKDLSSAVVARRLAKL